MKNPLLPHYVTQKKDERIFSRKKEVLQICDKKTNFEIGFF